MNIRGKNRRLSIFERYPVFTFVLVLLISILIFDLVAGYVFNGRSYNTFRCKHPFFHHGLLPNKKSNTTWNGEDYYSFYTNSLGFRDNQIREIPLQSDKTRILFIGDSHVEGVGLEFEKTFTGKLQSYLDTADIEVLNAGVVSYSPKLYYYKTLYLVDKVGLKFDRLIVSIDISDIQNELVYEKFEPEPENKNNSIKVRTIGFLNKHSFIMKFIAKRKEIKRKNEFYRKRERIIDNPRTDLYYSFFDEFKDAELLQNEDFHSIGSWYLDKTIFDKWGRKGLILEKWYMAKLNELCKSIGIELTITIHPWPIQIVAGDWNSIQVQFWEKFATDFGVDIVNFFPVLRQEAEHINVVKKYYFSGDVHFNEAGHKLFADELLKQIR